MFIRSAGFGKAEPDKAGFNREVFHRNVARRAVVCKFFNRFPGGTVCGIFQNGVVEEVRMRIVFRLQDIDAVYGDLPAQVCAEIVACFLIRPKMRKAFGISVKGFGGFGGVNLFCAS